jgi:hypothetical protein
MNLISHPLPAASSRLLFSTGFFIHEQYSTVKGEPAIIITSLSQPWEKGK